MRSGVRRLVATSVVTIVSALAAAAGMPAMARADGDPASDVLAVQKLFLPQDADVPIGQQQQLSALLKESARKGYPLRVAVVGSSSDLGSVAELWRRPQAYARFLGGELALVYHGSVLVVMPNGYGVDVTAPGARTASGTTQLPLPGQHLGAAAIIAVERFARSAGAAVTAPQMPAEAASRTADSLPWLVFGLGFIPLVLAWGTSLRQRPLFNRQRPH